MSIIGKTLGSFQCTALLGKGGMGEVYKAKDQKLGRDVAIKVLPEEFAKDADRVARFQREAKLLASLNHPNIAAIHGLEESEGIHFLVLELIEGQTLAERIKTGPVDVEEALKLALQIAEALEAAHEKGVIHRDLKPANIKVTPDGKVKVLDFGLAKAFAPEQEEMILSDSPTLSAAATQKGVILGTAAYMSPEQAKGKSLDKRTDVWAFGCVLFEMLTGEAAFQGEDVTEILASVVKASVDLEVLPRNLHPRVREVVGRCLQKDLRKRYAGISDVEYEIGEVLGSEGGVFVQPVPSGEFRTRMRQILPWIAATFVLTAIIIGLTVWRLQPGSLPDTRQVTRFYYEIPIGHNFSNPSQSNLAISHDGNKFAYTTSKGIYLRSMDEMEAKFVAGTDGNTIQPFFSPDDKWIGYWSMDDRQLKKISIVGGTPIPLSDHPALGYFDWCMDDTILYAAAEGIMRVSASGGNPETLIKAEDEAFFTPRFLPDGRSVIFTLDTDEGYKVAVQSLDSGQREVLFGGSDAHYLPTGHIIYMGMVGNDLFARPFNLEKLEPTGEAIPVVGNVFRGGAPIFSISDTGTLGYLTGAEVTPNRNLVWVDHEGNEDALNAPPDIYLYPRISPDGAHVAIGIDEIPNTGIWIFDILRGTRTQLTLDDTFESFPLWTPDGQWIVFSRLSGGSGYGIYRRAYDGAGAIEHLHSQTGQQIHPASWSGDEKHLIGQILRAGLDNYDIGMLSMDEDHIWNPLLQESHFESQPQISPDGELMAYTSNESDQDEIYVRPFPEVDKSRLKISSNGGYSPLWSPSGKDIFYRNGEFVMTVEIETKPDLRAGKPEILFRDKYFRDFYQQNAQWDISPDGKRFLMLKRVATTDEESQAEESTREIPRKVNFVINWFEELKDQVPVD